MHSMIIFANMVPAAAFLVASCGLALAQGQAGVGAGRIGSAWKVKGSVESNVQGRAYPLARGGSVYWQQFINTRAQSEAGLDMINQSKFHVGPSTSVRLNKPEWDPKTQKYHVSLHMLRKQGAPEAASGRLTAHGSDSTVYHVGTPEGRLTANSGR